MQTIYTSIEFSSPVSPAMSYHFLGWVNYCVYGGVVFSQYCAYFLCSQVRYLRHFPRLQSLALAGNPLASQEHYVHYVIAFVPSLVYLDFRMVMEEEVRWSWLRHSIGVVPSAQCSGDCVILKTAHTAPTLVLCCSGGVS